MEEESVAPPPIHIDDLIAQLLESKSQAERGEGRPADEILAEMEARFQKRFPSFTPRERIPD
jgi:hypothetical protein